MQVNDCADVVSASNSAPRPDESGPGRLGTLTITNECTHPSCTTESAWLPLWTVTKELFAVHKHCKDATVSCGHGIQLAHRHLEVIASSNPVRLPHFTCSYGSSAACRDSTLAFSIWFLGASLWVSPFSSFLLFRWTGLIQCISI